MKVFNNFLKRFFLRCLTGFWIRLWTLVAKIIITLDISDHFSLFGNIDWSEKRKLRKSLRLIKKKLFSKKILKIRSCKQKTEKPSLSSFKSKFRPSICQIWIILKIRQSKTSHFRSVSKFKKNKILRLYQVKTRKPKALSKNFESS